MPNIPKFTKRFNYIAKKHKFKTANETDNKVRDHKCKYTTWK